MSELVDLMRVLLGLNLLLLVGLGYVWGRNYYALRSKHSAGLFLFAVLLFGENALGLYFFLVDPVLTAWITNPSLVPPVAQTAMVVLRGLESAGLVFLTWITWD